MKIASLLLAAALLHGTAALAESFSVTGKDGKTYQIEDLGRPVNAKETDVDAITVMPDGSRIAWAAIASADGFGVLGQKIDGEGTWWVDLSSYGSARAEIAAYQDKLYIVIAQPVVKALVMDAGTREITELRSYPECGKSAYWNEGHARSADDKMYVGVYPHTYVVGIDLKTGTALDSFRVQKDPAQKYIVLPAVDNNGILYCPTGLVRTELYAVNLATGECKELFKGSPLEAAAKKTKGAPRVYLQEDGTCILSFAKRNYLCSFDGLQPSNFSGKHPKFPDNRRTRKNLIGPKTHALRFTEEGLLISRGYGKNVQLRTVPVNHELPGINVFGVHEQVNGKLYGSSVFPGRIFEWDIASGTKKDLGKLTSGAIQCYDIVSTPAGLVMSSYVGANLDLYDPDQPVLEGKNPRHLAGLGKYDQERIQRLTLAGKNYVCGGTIPCKGLLGGGIVRVDLRDKTVKYFGDLIPNQSISAVVAIPGTTLLCGGSSISGGTGAITKAKNAEIFLWDYEKGEMVWHKVMEPGIPSYQGLALTADNQVVLWYQKNKTQYWVLFDPAARQITARGKLDVTVTRNPFSHPLPVGKYKRNYFLSNGWIGYFDPAERTVKTMIFDKRLGQAGWQYCHVEADGSLYFPLGTHMLRVALEE